MSAKTIKRSSARAHKSPSGRALIETVRIFRNATHMFTPNGALTREGYELTRRALPDIALPAFDDLPLHSSVFHSSIQ